MKSSSFLALVFAILRFSLIESRRVKSNSLHDSSSPSRIDLRGNFTYCDVNNLKSIVNLDIDCQPIIRPPVKTLVFIEVLTKLHYVLDTKAYECYRQKVVRYLNTSFFGSKSESYFYVESPLSPIECLAMVESKRCNGQAMECTDDGCFYDRLPDGEFVWFQDIKLSNFNCKFHLRQVQAEKNTSVVFSNALNSCRPADLYCQLPRSIVIWKDSDVRQFMYGHVYSGDNYTLSGNILYSKESRYLFQLTDIVSEGVIELHRSTEGLYIFLMLKEKNNVINDAFYDYITNSYLYGSDTSYMPKMASLFDLELAEQDFQYASIQGEFQKKINEEFVKDCAMFLNHLHLLAKFEDQLHRVRDLNDNEAILYSKFGQLFLPRCDLVRNVTIAQYEKECFVDTPVEVVDSYNRSSRLFLNKKNFLVDYSPSLNCNSVNTRQMINSTHFLIRVRNSIKVNVVADLKLVDLTSQNYNFDEINFNHHSQIIDGFDLINDFHDRHEGNENDMNDHYHILPEDNIDEKHNIINDWKEKISSEVGAWWNKIMASLKSFFYSVFGFLILLAVLFFLYMHFFKSNLSQMPGIFIDQSKPSSSTTTTTENEMSNENTSKVIF